MMSETVVHEENVKYLHLSGENLSVYSNKDRVSQMRTSMNYGLDEDDKDIFDHLGLLTPTEHKILDFIKKYIDHNTNMVSMTAETFGLHKANFRRALLRFREANFIRKIGKDDLPNKIVKKNTYMLNPYMLIPQYGSRALAADIWNRLRGHPTNFAGSNLGAK